MKTHSPTHAGRRLTGCVLIFIFLANALAMPVMAAVSTCTTNVGTFTVHYNCVTESVGVETIAPKYDNGMAGALDPSNYTQPWHTWPTVWNGSNGAPLPDGVTYSPLQEVAVRLYGANNLTARENTTDRPAYIGPDGLLDTSPDPAIRALEWHVTLNATKVMSGGSEWYYRSPILWDFQHMIAEYVNVHDESGRLVAAGRFDTTAISTSNVTNSEMDNSRIYYRFQAPLHAFHRYTFTEWIVRPSGDRATGLDHIDAYVAANQDMDSDGIMQTILFPGENAQHTQTGEFDPAWSIRLVYGMGPGGSFDAIVANDVGHDNVVTLRSGATRTLNGTSTNNVYHVEIPLRTTVPLNVTLQLWICGNYTQFQTYHGDSSCGAASGNSGHGIGFSRDLANVTGTISETFATGGSQPISDAGSRDGGNHYAAVKLIIDGFNETKDANGTNFAVLSYPIYEDTNPDGSPVTHVAQRCNYYSGGCNETQPSMWSMWVSVTEEFVPTPTATMGTSGSSDHNLLSLLPCHGTFTLFGSQHSAAAWCIGLGVLLLAACVIAPEVGILAILAAGADTTATAVLGATTIGLGVFSVGLATTGGVQGFFGDQETRSAFNAATGEAWQFMKGAALATVCAGALVAPAVGAGIGGLVGAGAGGIGAAPGAAAGLAIGRGVQVAAAVGCGIIAAGEAGILGDFYKLLLDIPQLLKSAVDVVGALLASLLQIAVALWQAFGPWVYLLLYWMTALTVVLLFREAILVAIAWIMLPFMAMGSQAPVILLKRAEDFMRMLPTPGWDAYLRKKWGVIRGTHYRDERYGRNPSAA